MNLSTWMLWCAVALQILFQKCEGNCLKLSFVRNGYVTYSSEGQAEDHLLRYPSGTVVTFHCDTGYNPTAPTRRCRGSSWSYPLVHCRASCSDNTINDTTAVNARAEFDSDPFYSSAQRKDYSIGTVRTTVCLPGFNNYGGLGRSIECQTGDNDGGVWITTSETEVDCRRPGICLPISFVRNGYVEYSLQPQLEGNVLKYPHGTVATWHCNTGYNPTAPTRRCRANSWTYPLVHCRASCSDDTLDDTPPVDTMYEFDSYPIHSSAQRKVYSIGTVRTTVCLSGFNNYGGPGSIECKTGDNGGGAWITTSETEPDCRVSCESLSLSNGAIQYSTEEVDGRYATGTTASFTCNSGYSRSGHSSSTCQESGNWNHATPACNAVPPPPPPPPPPSDRGCFPSMAEVQLKNGKTVTMSKLQIGDKVKTVSPSGSINYSEVTALLRKQSVLSGMYMSMTTSLNTTVSMTANHLIYARKHCSEKFHPVYAKKIVLGDEVLVQNNDKMNPTKIIKISMFVNQGVYAPLTSEGNIVVDGVLTSCYASFDHDLAHVAMTPIQWFPEIIQWIFGDANGSSSYAEMNTLIGKLILPYGQLHNRK